MSPEFEERARMSMPTKTKLRPTVTDDILTTLRTEIVTGELPKGARFPVAPELARRFGVSQPTIREVVRALEAMGLVEVRHGSGAWVTGDASYMVSAGLQALVQLESVSIIEAVEMRILLSTESARQAARNRTPADIAVLERTLADLDGRTPETRTVEDVVNAVTDFQLAVSASAHNALGHAIESFLIRLQLGIQVSVFADEGIDYWLTRTQRFQPDRREIVSAIADGDEERAYLASIGYLHGSREVFQSDPRLAALSLTDDHAVDSLASALQKSRSAAI